MNHEKDRTDNENSFLRSFKFKIEHAHPNQSTGYHYKRDDRRSRSGRGYSDNRYDRNRHSVDRFHNHGYNNWRPSDRRNNYQRNNNRRGRRVNYNRSRNTTPIKDYKYDNFLCWRGAVNYATLERGYRPHLLKNSRGSGTYSGVINLLTLKKWHPCPGEIKLKISQQIEHLGNLVATTNENILVIDNGCDQTIININSFLIYTFAGVKCKVNSALSKMSSSSLELVSDTYTLVTIDENIKKI